MYQPLLLQTTSIGSLLLQQHTLAYADWYCLCICEGYWEHGLVFWENILEEWCHDRGQQSSNKSSFLQVCCHIIIAWELGKPASSQASPQDFVNLNLCGRGLYIYIFTDSSDDPVQTQIQELLGMMFTEG